MSTLLAFPAERVPRLHTAIAASAFAVALLAGYIGGTWQDLCTNEVAKWPDEWFPSVSATIGDHAASRSPFHILIALCATPRFLLLGLQWLAHRHSHGGSADIALAIGLARTFSCGGWVYITSRDHHGLHDLFMIIYLALTLPWMALVTAASLRPDTKRRRRWLMSGFTATLPFLVWQFHRHAVSKIPGAYTHYAFFEWSLVIWDVCFDAMSVADLRTVKIVILDTSGTSPIPPVPRKESLDWTTDEHTTQLQAIAAYLSDVAFGMTFWTVFTSLPFQLFYWSVWELALAGSELALLANLSPILLANRDLRHWVQTKDGLLWLRGLTVVFGLGCYIAPLPIVRLVGVVIGTGAGWLAVLSPLIRVRGGHEARAEAQVLLIALAAVTLLKHMNSSINPFWASTDAMSGGWNKTGLTMMGLSLLEVSKRSPGLFPSAPVVVKDKPLPTRSADVAVAVGFGALIHLLHTFATDAGTVLAWTWTGFPVKGPNLHPYGGLVMATLVIAAGLRLDSRLSLALVFVGTAGVYAMSDWIGCAFGLIAVVGLVTIFPPYLQSVSALPLAHTVGWAMAVYGLLDVVSVVTVAYAFIPFGRLLRERTDLVLSLSCLAIAAGSKTYHPPAMTPRSQRRIASTRRFSYISVALLAVVSIAYGYWKIPRSQPIPYSDHRIFSGGIWTVHFGVDAAGRDSQYRMMELIRDMEVDVVGLLESDLHRMVYGNRDLTRIIAEELGYYVDLGPGPDKHTWGAALLSKFPIVNSTHHLLPSPRGELAPAIHATLDIHGEMVNVMVSHNGQEEDPVDRELQTTEIARLLRENADTPTVFLGYLVTQPGAKRPAPYQILIEDGLMYDIEKDDTFRWCEYIAFRGLWRIAYARIHESDISDTELQVGRFLLPAPGTKAQYDNDEQRYWHIGESDIPAPWRLPSMFRDEGVRGHKYIIWRGPVYYFPPTHSGLQLYGR